MLKGQGRFARPIVSIAILGIILGVTIMLTSMAIVRGFRSEIRDKVVAFNAHIQVKHISSIYGEEGSRVLIDPEAMGLADIDGVRHVQLLAQRSALIETKDGIDGVMAKGVGADYDTTFFASKTVVGRLPDFSGTEASKEILVSTKLAARLDVEVGDRVSLYFIEGEDDISTRRLTISGLFSTDLDELDMQYVLIDMRHLQKVNDWGLQAQIAVSDTCGPEGIGIKALSFGGEGMHYYQWSNEWKGPGPHFICPKALEQLWVVVYDDVETVPDTAFLSLRNERAGICDCAGIDHQLVTSGGSQRYYSGGYELFVDDFDELAAVHREVNTKVSPLLAASNIVEQTPEIFSWLELFDVNVYIIITLMVGVAIINMSSALLITIIERTNMIGILKALGSDDWSIRMIFMRHAAHLIGKGLLWGNVIAFTLCWIQHKYEVVTLSADTYFLSVVPVIVDWRDVLLIDLGTLLICVGALILPSYLITRISPVQAIRFD